MSLESVRAFLAENAPDVEIVELTRNSETHSLATAWRIEPAQIAKTLTLRVGDRNVLLVACGDSRLDNKKVKAALGGKPRMLPAEEAAVLTGHPVGGVCPFGLATPLPIYCDILLKRYDVVVPGAGSTHAAMRIAPTRLAQLAGAAWVDVCEPPR
jgi:prolyl-tRNA editing enzyme YbaK/EbsC (Cys-tRNA(Pro) deacylase)